MQDLRHCTPKYHPCIPGGLLIGFGAVTITIGAFLLVMAGRLGVWRMTHTNGHIDEEVFSVSGKELLQGRFLQVVYEFPNAT